MTRQTAIAILLLAAILEAGGDALMRTGLQRSPMWQRALFFSLAALVLFPYGEASELFWVLAHLW